MSASVASLPRSADVLYLEMCGENFADLRYARGNDVIDLVRNTCSVVILITCSAVILIGPYLTDL